MRVIVRGEIRVQSRHDLCTFTHACGDPLDRPRADVTDGEDAAYARLEKPAAIVCVIAGQNKSLRV
jgi:hypothetical protein